MNTDSSSGPVEIDLHRIIGSRLPRTKARLVPGFVISLLTKVIHQDELNAMLRAGWPETGSRFAARLLEHLGITVTVRGLDSLPPGRYMFASNHPLGGLDGIALIKVLGERYGDDGVRFLVNDLLMNVKPLSGMFLPINKFGRQGRGAATAINEALASGMQILQFPAGLVSRLQPDGSVRDLEWHKAFVSKALEYERDIVPVHFIASNRKRFYRLAHLRKQLNIKVNLEQALLPAELCAARGAHFEIVFGSPIPYQALKASGAPATTIADQIKDRAYSLS